MICNPGLSKVEPGQENPSWPGISLVRPEGLEPSTLGLRVPCSAKLSYGRTPNIMGCPLRKGKGAHKGLPPGFDRGGTRYP